eukprot:jgi/Bigna1/90602/estExt_fgenesh1_pg.C_740044
MIQSAIRRRNIVGAERLIIVDQFYRPGREDGRRGDNHGRMSNGGNNPARSSRFARIRASPLPSKPSILEKVPVIRELFGLTCSGRWPGKVRERIIIIDGLRVVAVLTVLFFHWMTMTIAPDSMDSKFPYGKDAYQRAFFQSPLIRVLRLGERAVDIFQVLSGFLFARSVYRRKYGGYWTSLVSRYLRLLPPHMAAFALEAILNPYNMRSSCFKALPYHLLGDQYILNKDDSKLASCRPSEPDVLLDNVLRRYLIGQRIDRGGKAAAFAFFLNDGRGLVIFFFVGIVIRAYSAFYLEKPIWYANSLATHLSPYIAGIWACMAIEGGDYVLKHELPLQDLSSTSQKESRVTKQQQQQQQQSRFHPTVVAIMFHRYANDVAA